MQGDPLIRINVAATNQPTKQKQRISSLYVRISRNSPQYKSHYSRSDSPHKEYLSTSVSCIIRMKYSRLQWYHKMAKRRRKILPLNNVPGPNNCSVTKYGPPEHIFQIRLEISRPPLKNLDTRKGSINGLPLIYLDSPMV